MLSYHMYNTINLFMKGGVSLPCNILTQNMYAQLTNTATTYNRFIATGKELPLSSPRNCIHIDI
jgi:hypothetical protein